MMRIRRTKMNEPLTTPLLFKMWFVIVFGMVAMIWVTVGYSIYKTATDPVGAGQTVGAIISGFEKGFRQ